MGSLSNRRISTFARTRDRCADLLIYRPWVRQVNGAICILVAM